MYYLVCYETETAVAIGKGWVDLKQLKQNCPPSVRKFFKTVGKRPIALIDQDYPSYSAVLDNYQLIV